MKVNGALDIPGRCGHHVHDVMANRWSDSGASEETSMRVMGLVAMLSWSSCPYLLGLVLYQSGLWDVEPGLGAIVISLAVGWLVLRRDALRTPDRQEEDCVEDDDEERIDRS